MKIIKIGTEARNDLIEGANFIADAVKSTLGPYGQNFFLEKGNKVTNDGYTIAAEIEHKDEIKNRGVIAVRQATTKTNEKAGDGTTSAITLAQAILSVAVRDLADTKKGRLGKKTPAEIIHQIEIERKEVTEKLMKMAEPVESEAQMIESALVSVEDEELSQLIGKMQWELGKDGIIFAEETAEPTSSIEKVKGVRIDNGLGTSSIMNNQEKQCLEISDAKIILTSHTIQDFKNLSKLLEQLHKSGQRKLIVIARAFTPEAIRLCMDNIQQGSMEIYPINGPYTDMKEIMQDLAAVLGGRYYDAEDSSLEDIQLSDVGFVQKMVARRYDAVLTGKEDDQTQERIDKRIAQLKEKLKGSESDFEKKNLNARIAQLTNGFAILKVGSVSEIERKRLKDKADDAVNAVRAALQEGVVKGAGLAFKEISDELPDTYLLKRPLLSIYEQIMSTAPADFTIPEWVKDPVFVLRIALENACSVAGSIATAAGVTAAERIKPRYVEEVNNNQDEN